MRGPQLAQEYEAYRFSPLAGIKFAERPDNFLVIRSVDFGFSPLAGIKFAESPPPETLTDRGFYKGFSWDSFSPSFQPHLLKPILIY